MQNSFSVRQHCHWKTPDEILKITWKLVSLPVWLSCISWENKTT